ncbi:hypothetical protein ACFWWC_48860 [Streptomyces sp. NPDC058642]|uniref:hypothetical protein n=1 Tax=Streptomyces sp. NPDC058642 TaxID=3346572 RepID=UPI00365883E4
MKIPLSVTVPGGLGIGTAVALPAPVVVVTACVLVVLALAVQVPSVLSCLTVRYRVQSDVAFRKELLDAVPGLPEGDRAGVVCELARSLNPSSPPSSSTAPPTPDTGP